MNGIVSVNIMGGLGNQLFQLACAYAYAKKNNSSLLILRHKRIGDGRPVYWDTLLYRFQEFLVDTLPENLEQWYEKGPTEFNIIAAYFNKGVFLNGYFQSAKYFGDSIIQNEIRELFKPTDNVLYYIKNKFNFLMENKERVVVVHARRGDYVANQHMINYHGPLSTEYYKEAVQRMCEIVSNPIFLLVSDDSQYWNEIDFNKIEFFILNNEDEINTIGLIQQFKYFIIANSSYSWWGAWLSDPKMVIAPSKWFGPIGPQNYKDIYIPSWILI